MRSRSRKYRILKPLPLGLQTLEKLWLARPIILAAHHRATESRSACLALVQVIWAPRQVVGQESLQLLGLSAFWAAKSESWSRSSQRRSSEANCSKNFSKPARLSLRHHSVSLLFQCFKGAPYLCLFPKKYSSGGPRVYRSCTYEATANSKDWLVIGNLADHLERRSALRGTTSRRVVPPDGARRGTGPERDGRRALQASWRRKPHET